MPCPYSDVRAVSRVIVPRHEDYVHGKRHGQESKSSLHRMKSIDMAEGTKITCVSDDNVLEEAVKYMVAACKGTNCSKNKVMH